MRTWHVFYNTDRDIMWCSDAGVTASIISQQQAENLRYLEVSVDGMLDASLNYINEAEDNVVGKTAFEPSIPSLEPVLGTPLSITNIPIGTKVIVEGISHFPTMYIVSDGQNQFSVAVHSVKKIK